jgi:O-antigen ligase
LFVLILLGAIHSNTAYVFPYLLGFSVFYLFIFSLFQYQFSSKDIYLILFIIVCLGFIEAVISLVQIFDVSRIAYHLTGYSPFLKIGTAEGTFQQVNILANFMALNLIIGFYLLFYKYQNKYSTYFIYFTTIVMVFIVMVSGSRAGLLATVVGVVFMHYALRGYIKKYLSVYLKWLITAVLGIVLAIFLQKYYGLFIEKSLSEKVVKVIEGSDVRWFLYDSSINMLFQAPWFGCGLGNFQNSFQNYINEILQAKGVLGFDWKLVTHPHNEILYYAVQSGVFGLFAIVLFSMYTLARIFKNNQQNSWVFLAFLSPFIIQSQVSLPFLLSALFLLLFAFFLVLGVRPNHVICKFSFNTSVNLVFFAVLIFFLVLSSYQARYSLLAIDEFYYFKNRLFLYQNTNYSRFESQGYFLHASNNILYADVVENTMNDLAERSLKNNNQYDMKKYNDWFNQANINKPKAQTLLMAIKINAHLGLDENVLKFYSRMKSLYPFSVEYKESLQYYNSVVKSYEIS